MAYQIIKESDGTVKVIRKKAENTVNDVRDVNVIPLFNINRPHPQENISLNKEKIPANPDIPAKSPIPTIGPDLEEWRRINIPTWRRILKESQQTNDKGREEYARWMLVKVLEVNEE